MKIGVNTLFFIPGEVGGMETYVREVLFAMATSSCDVDWVLYTNRENHNHIQGIFGKFPRFTFHLLPLKATNRYSRILREQIDLPFRVAASRIDVLWSPGYTMPFFSPCPQVVTIPDMQYRRYPEDLTWIARIATNILVRIAVRRSKGIITISEFSRREILTFTHALRASVYTVHLGVDLAFAKALPEDMKRQKLKKLISNRNPYILCIANTYPHKNVPALIEGFSRVMKKISHQLVLVGKPRLGESEVQAALRKVSDTSRIQRFLEVDFEDLRALYQGADLFIFPSLYEGFGLPVVEAMMSGVPVLTTKCGSIPEVGGDRVCYFDPDSETDLSEKIMDIVFWEKEYRKLWILKAQEYARRFSWERTAEKTMECFKKVDKGNG